MPTGRQLVARAETQFGDTYVFAGEIKPGTVNPNRYDCSEFWEWDTAMEGVSPPLPDGAANQFFHCKRHGLLIPVDEARWIPGALLFVATPSFMRTGKGSGRSAFTHVAGSRGDNTTAEARGADWGVGSWPIGNRFTHAALIPGVDYQSEEDDMAGAGDEILSILKQSFTPAITELLVTTRAIAKEQGLDEGEIAKKLAPLLKGAIVTLDDEDLAEIAEAVNDESHRRSAG